MTDIHIEPLTDGEAEVLALLAEDLTNKEIANRLYKSVRTIEDYVRRLNAKLDTSNRQEIVERAGELGLLAADKPETTPAKSNLPGQFTPFVGRETELDAVRELLSNPDIRLLTILASGGMGKTRLAIEAAEQQQSNFSKGVYFVPMQPIVDPANIVSQIATSTGYQFTDDGREPKQQILDYLGNKQMLLVMDNFEHLLDGAPLVSDILKAAPEVKVLATCREKLNLSGETVYALSGLQFPAWETPEDALEYDAVQLLVSVAKRVKPDWAVTQDNLHYVARVCRLTQGMPLGILLAAGWLDVLSLEQICDEIQHNADFLETELRDVPERQRSIRAVFEYSWERLKPAEQQAFMRMSVFRGGCSTQAVEAVTGANPRTLQGLVNKALLIRNREGRYDIHELLRQYAETRLVQAGEAETIRDVHMRYYANALDEREAHLKDHRQLEALNDIAADFENARAAWQWALQREHFQIIERMAFSTATYSKICGRMQDGIDLLEEAIDQGTQRPGEADSLWLASIKMFLGNLLSRQAKHDVSQSTLESSLENLRRHDNPDDIALCLAWLTITMASQGQLAEALRLAYESLSFASITDDIWTKAWANYYFGYALICQNRPKEAHEYFCHSLEFFSNVGDTFGTACTHSNLGYVCSELGLLEDSHRHTLQAYQFHKKIGNKSGMALSLSNLGAYMSRAGNWKEIEQYQREALAMRREIVDTHGIVWSLAELAGLALNTGRFEEAEQLISESLVFARDINTPDVNAVTFNVLSMIAELHGDHEEAYRLAQEAHQNALKSGNNSTIAIANTRVGWALCSIGQYEDAVKYLTMALRRWLPMKSTFDEIEILAALAQIVAHRGDSEHATKLLGLAFEHPIQIVWLDHHRKLMELRQQLKQELGEHAYNAAWEYGKTLDLDTVVQNLLVDFVEDEDK